uniref:Uncharacterized protein n=1 Tax=viral metagenome TaxID=1070528 RepID=A0A6H1ZRK2_9ZZZZ
MNEKIINYVRMATMIDCDGSISFPPSQKSLVMQFGSIHRHYAELPKRIFGCGTVGRSPPSKNTKAKDYWVWCCAKFVALRILLQIYPYLILKKEKAGRFIAYYTALYSEKKRFMNRQGIFLRNDRLVIDIFVVPYQQSSLKKIGRPPRTLTHKNSNYKKMEVLHQLYWKEEKSISEIAAMFEVDGKTIHYWMNKLNIPRR